MHGNATAGTVLPTMTTAAPIETAAIAEALRALAATDDLASVLAATVRGAVQLSAATGGLLLVADEVGGKLSYGAGCGGVALPSAQQNVAADLAALLSWDGLLLPVDLSARFAPLSHLVSNCGHIAGVPVRLDGWLLGLLLLEFRSEVPEDRLRDTAFALFVEQAAFAFQKAHNLAALHRQVGDASARLDMDDAMRRGITFQDTLQRIITLVKQLVDAEMGGLMLYDPDSDELVLQEPAFGATEEQIQKYHVPLSVGGNAVTVFRTGQSYMSNDAAGDPAMLQHFIKLFGARSVITVPLDVDGRRIGVFHVVNKRNGGFTEDDLRLVSMLASHFALMMHNAQLLENERKAVAKLSELNEVIECQREGLRRTLTVHDQLTRLVLDGMGLNAIAAALGDLLGNGVTVEDRFGNLIAWHQRGATVLVSGAPQTVTAFGRMRGTRGEAEARALVAMLGAERRPVRVEANDRLGLNEARVVAPILVGEETLGYVSVLECDRRLDELDFVTVERAAIAIALQMMKDKAAVDARYKLRSDLVAELLTGMYGPNEVARARAAYLGIDLGVRRTALAVGIDDFGIMAHNRRPSEEKVLALKATLLDVVEEVCHKASPHTLLSMRGDEIVLFAATSERANTAGLRAELFQLADALRGAVRRWLPEVSVSVGIGDLCSSLADYARSYQQARRALDAIRASRDCDCTRRFDQAGIYAVLLDPHNREKLVTLVSDMLGRLLQYDRDHRAELVETLDQFLQNDCHLERTASALQIHIGTLRYRLRRITEISGTELNKFEAKSDLRLALTVLRALNLR